MKKKLLCVFLFVVLISLSACGKANEMPADFDLSTYTQLAQAYTATAASLPDTDLQISAHEDAEPFCSLSSGTLTAIEEAGSPMQMLGTSAKNVDGVVTITVEVQHEERIVDYDYTFEKNPKQEYNPSAEPYVITEIVVAAQYSMAELMKEAGMNTIMGMGIVFLVLIFICFVISLFKYLPGSGAQKQKPEAKESPVATPASVPVAAQAVSNENLVNDKELVAVITAAIMAANGSGSAITSSDQLIVRSIKRVSR